MRHDRLDCCQLKLLQISADALVHHLCAISAEGIGGPVLFARLRAAVIGFLYQHEKAYEEMEVFVKLLTKLYVFPLQLE